MAKKTASIPKITRPKITGIFSRKRLFQQIDARRDCPVVWVTGPPGSGKTTLVASYLDARKLSCLWYQVDSGDADLATFFYYMGMAAKRAFPRKRKPLPLLTPEYLPNISVFTQRYFEELYGRLTPPFAVIFDNYQDAPAESKFHDIISIGLSAIPEGIHGIVVSRNDPLPAFSRLRANNKIYCIGWNELRLTLEESREIVRMKGQRSLTDEILADLHKKTDGWAAGLVLLMEIARIKNIEYPILKELTPQEIFDYFANEVFEKTDTQIQTFLLKTTFLPRMTAYMAAKLTGVHDSEQILLDLNKSHYFTTQYGYYRSDTGKSQGTDVQVSLLSHAEDKEAKLSHANIAYQYHPLFREFLQSLAKSSFNPEELLQTKRCAAAILEESGLVEDAAVLYCDAGGWDALVKLILNHAPSFIENGRFDTLQEWLMSVPAEIVKNTPWLMYWYGICLMPHNPTESRDYFDRAFEQFRSQGEQTGMWLSWSYAVDTFFHEFENFSPLDRYISVFDDLYHEGYVFSTPEVEFRVISCRFISMMMREQYLPKIGKWAGRTVSCLRECKDVNLRLVSGYYLAVHYMWIGDFTNAGVVMNTVSEGMHTETVLPLERLLWETTRAMYAWLTGDIASCLHIVSDALKLADETGVHIWDHHLLSHGACASLSAGDTETAAEFLKRIEPGLVHTRKIDIGFYHFLSAWKELICGNAPSAVEHAKISMETVLEVDVYLPIAANGVALSQAFAAMGKYGDAFAQLELVWQIGHRANSNHIKFMCLLTEAHFAIDYGIYQRKGGTVQHPHLTSPIEGEETFPRSESRTGFPRPWWEGLGEGGELIRNGEREIRGNGEKETDGSAAASHTGSTACIDKGSRLGEAERTQQEWLVALRKAMSLGREQNLVNCFGWRPDIMAKLCVKALEAGIEVEYVQNLIRKRNLIPDTTSIQCENWPWQIKVFTLGRFAILKDDEAIQFTGKAQRKPLELLKAIISSGGREVSENQVTDLLWPDAEGDLAHQSFNTTLHRLRRLLGTDMAIGHQGGQLTLDARYCWVDTWAFERLYEQIESWLGELERTQQKYNKDGCSSLIIEALRLTEKATGIYKGAFLPSDTGYLWSISTRERLRNKFIRLIDIIGNCLERSGHWQQAKEHFQRAIVVDDLVEEFYQHLMICYHTLGQKAEAVKVYNRCCTMLSKVLGISPSQKTEDIYQTLI